MAEGEIAPAERVSPAQPATSGKLLVPAIAAAVAIALIVIALSSKPREVAGAEPGAQVALLSEPAIIKEVSIGGLVLSTDGVLARTYSDKAPEACPT